MELHKYDMKYRCSSHEQTLWTALGICDASHLMRLARRQFDGKPRALCENIFIYFEIRVQYVLRATLLFYVEVPYLHGFTTVLLGLIWRMNRPEIKCAFGVDSAGKLYIMAANLNERRRNE